jgi:hypothetical protein
MQIKRCNNLSRILAFYLINVESKKRIINIFSSFNITILYIIVQDIKIRFLNLNTKKIYIKNNFSNTITIYSNFNIVEY